MVGGVQSHEDLCVTLAAAAGMPNLKPELLSGKKVGDMTCKAHLDSYNQLDYRTGKNDKSAHREFFYYDETDLMTLGVEGWSSEGVTNLDALGFRGVKRSCN